MIVPALLLVAGFAAIALLLQPLGRRAAVWPIVEPLPFAILAAAAIVLRGRWEEIPPRFAVHFAADGAPDGWAPRSTEGVFGPLVVGVVVVLVLALARAAVMASRARDGGASRRLASGTLLGLETFVALTFATVSFLALGATLRLVLGVVFGGVFLLLLALAANLAALARQPPAAGEHPQGGWRAGGLVYGEARDPDLWIPKRIGVGWTLNFAHPAARWVLALLLLAPIAVVAAAYFVATSR